MKITNRSFVISTPKTHDLGVTEFIPAGKIKKTLVISSATGVLQVYYSKFACFMAQKGYASYTFDYHGIGASGASTSQLRKNTTQLSEWGSNDQASIVEWVKKRYPKKPLMLVTHSVGGQVLGFNSKNHLIDGVLMVASQTGYWRDYRNMHKYKMWFFWYAMLPFLTSIFGYFPAKGLGLFENLPPKMVSQWWSWGKQRQYMLGQYKLEQTSFLQLKCPVLALSFSTDNYAPTATVDHLVSFYKNAKIYRGHLIAEALNLPLIGHFGFFRSKFKNSLWEMALQWFESNKVPVI